MLGDEKEIGNIGEPSSKEEFDIGLTDDQLLRQIQDWEKDSEEYYGQLETIWAENENYYRGIQTDVQRIWGKFSKAVENRIFMAIETEIPIATARLPDIEALSLAEDEQSQMDAEDLKDILLHQLDRLNIQEKMERGIRNMEIKRYMAFKVIWDKKADDVGLLELEPKRIRIPRHGKEVKDLKYLIEELEISYDQAVEFFGETKAKELQKIGANFLSRIFKSEKVRRATFSIQEVWTNEFVVWRAHSQILKKQKNPFYDFENPDRNHLPFPLMPYVLKSLYHTRESIIGDTDKIQQTKPIQDNINIRKRQIEDIVNKVADPPLLIDSDAMSEEEAANITNEPGKIFYGKDVATKVQFAAPGQVPVYLFNDLEFSRNEFDNIWGIHSTTRGEREGRETLGGRKLLKQADLGRIDLIARQVERALNDIADYFTQLIKLYYNDKRAFTILGDDGIRFIKDFSNEKVKSIRLIVRPGSTLPKDEVTIHDEAITLWQLQAIGPKTLFKMLKLPNQQDALQDLQDYKTGNITGSGGAQVPPPGMGAAPPLGGMGGEPLNVALGQKS